MHLLWYYQFERLRCTNSFYKEQDLGAGFHLNLIYHLSRDYWVFSYHKDQCLHSTGKMIAIGFFLLWDDLINVEFDEIHLHSEYDNFIGDTDPKSVASSAQVDFIKNSMFFEFTKKLFHNSLNQ